MPGLGAGRAGAAAGTALGLAAGEVHAAGSMAGAARACRPPLMRGPASGGAGTARAGRDTAGAAGAPGGVA